MCARVSERSFQFCSIVRPAMCKCYLFLFHSGRGPPRGNAAPSHFLLSRIFACKERKSMKLLVFMPSLSRRESVQIAYEIIIGRVREQHLRIRMFCLALIQVRHLKRSCKLSVSFSKDTKCKVEAKCVRRPGASKPETMHKKAASCLAGAMVPMAGAWFAGRPMGICVCGASMLASS